ncbi:hypothetical protein K427_25760 [Escherichia coli MP1]|nr:hypothetical protein K427_25760 [Escherichia coli MP1]
MFFYSSRAHCAASAISRTSGREVAAATSQRHAELSSAINHGKLPLHGRAGIAPPHRTRSPDDAPESPPVLDPESA